MSTATMSFGKKLGTLGLARLDAGEGAIFSAAQEATNLRST
jgi:hypothetical protein